MSEKPIRQQQAGAHQVGKNEPSAPPPTSLGPALERNSLSREQEKHTIRKPEVQIGNSD